MKKYFLAGAACLGIAFTAQSADLSAVTPGMGTKDLQLGMPESVVVALLGEAPVGDAAMGRIIELWTEGPEKKPQVEVFGFRGDAYEPAITQIIFFGKGAKVGPGVEVGVPLPKEIFQDPLFTKVETLPNGLGMVDNLKAGVAFLFSMEGERICQGIIVHRKDVEPKKPWYP